MSLLAELGDSGRRWKECWTRKSDQVDEGEIMTVDRVALSRSRSLALSVLPLSLIPLTLPVLHGTALFSKSKRQQVAWQLNQPISLEILFFLSPPTGLQWKATGVVGSQSAAWIENQEVGGCLRLFFSFF